jgi:galactose mutarotase-like enzyme
VQKIANDFLTLSVSEKTGSLLHLLASSGSNDYLTGVELAPVLFPALDSDLLAAADWVVVDKGDDRISLTTIASDETKKSWRHDFELMLTYRLVDHQVEIRLSLTNTGQQDFDYQLGWQTWLHVTPETRIKLTPSLAEQDLLKPADLDEGQVNQHLRTVDLLEQFPMRFSLGSFNHLLVVKDGDRFGLGASDHEQQTLAAGEQADFSLSLDLLSLTK